jgi:protein ImuB
MCKRFVSIWFRYLQTDWFTLRRPVLQEVAFVLACPDHGRMVISSANSVAQAQGVDRGMVVADARAIIPSLQVLDDKPGLSNKLLKRIAEWCIRYTPAVAIDPPDGLILDISGCAHLWGGEDAYLTDIITRLKDLGYKVRAAIADTVGAAWAIARFGRDSLIIKPSQQTTALLSLPPSALRLEGETVARLHKLGLRQINNFIGMPRAALRRRFGQLFIKKLDQALGHEDEVIQPVQPIEPYQERLPCLEPIVTATGIEIALERLLQTLCTRLKQEQKGLRAALFKGYRVDGKIEKIEIGTNLPSYNARHIFKLFEIKLPTIEPALGIDLFMLEAQKVEDVSTVQEKLWEKACGLDNIALSELLDRLAGKIGANHIHRYIPDEHYWPERSVKPASSLHEKPTTLWRIDRPRPLQLLSAPEPIEVSAPIPDYPPMLFRHKGKLHKITKADGPERIEPEWWLQQGQHRDYYCVEDEAGNRYWLFRLGHYDAAKTYQWFIHGFFA